MPEDNNSSGEFILANKAEPDKLATEKPIQEKPQEIKHAKKSPHFFSSFCYMPRGVSFSTQQEDEEIILLIRRDFITNVPWIASVFGMIALPFLVAPFFDFLFPFLSFSDSTLGYILFFYFLIIYGFIIHRFSLWYFHVSFVTNIRIVDVDVHGILIREITETRLELVEDISYKQIGFIPSFFDYGEVHIQTAGAQQNIEFDKAPNPAKIAEIIGDRIGGKDEK